MKRRMALFSDSSMWTLAAISMVLMGWAMQVSALDTNSYGFKSTITVNYRDYFPLTNFPLLVKLGPHMSGFSHAQFAHGDGSDLRFTDAAGNELAYEIDQWNPSGTSLVWVEIPTLMGNGTTNWFDGQHIWTTPWDGNRCSLEIHNNMAWIVVDRNDGSRGYIRGKEIVDTGFPFRDHWNFANWNRELYPNPATINWAFTNVSANPSRVYNVGEVVGYRSIDELPDPAQPVYCRQYNGYYYLELSGNFVNVLNLGMTMFDGPGTNAARMTWQNLMQFCDYDPHSTNEPFIHIPANTNTQLPMIWAYWGNAAATRPAYTTNGSAWSGGYAAIWHMSETNVVDSRKRGSVSGPGTPHAVSLTSAGQIGSAVSFNSAVQSYIDLGSFNFGVTGNQSYAIEAWIHRSGSGTGSDPSICYGNGTALKTAGLGVSGGMYKSMHGGGSYDKIFGTGPSNGEWQHVVMLHYRNLVEAWNGNTYTDQLWINGRLVSGVAENNTPYPSNGDAPMLALDATAPLYFGTTWDSSYVGPQIMDEVRMSSVPRSQPWIRASYLTVASNTTFQTYGAVSNTGSFSYWDPQVLPAGATWRYWNSGSVPSGAWTNRIYDDSGWSLGAAPFGYTGTAESDVMTHVGYGGNATDKWITTYYRASFVLTNVNVATGLVFSLKVDDGAVWYLNGTERGRYNMYTGPVAFTNRSVGGATNAPRPSLQFEVSPDGLVPGTNVIVVEVHQQKPDTSDLYFDLGTLVVPYATSNQSSAVTAPPPPVTTNTPLVGMVPRWRQAQVSGTMYASSVTLYLYTSNSTAGVMIDDVHMGQGAGAGVGANLIMNPGFESGTNGWDMVGQFAGASQIVGSYVHGGAASLLLRAASPVANGGSGNSVRQNVSGMVSGAVHTLSFWYLATNAVDFVARYSAHPSMATLDHLESGGTLTNGFFILGASTVVSNNTMQVAWESRIGGVYRVMMCTSLAEKVWTPQGVVTAGNGTASVNLPVAGPGRFYKLVDIESP